MAFFLLDYDRYQILYSSMDFFLHKVVFAGIVAMLTIKALIQPKSSKT